MSLLKPIRAAQLNKSHPLARGLVGCWLFNEGSGGKAFDLSGNANIGTLYGDTASKPGKFGNCLYFDGSGDYVTASNIGQITALGNYTFTAWIYVTGPDTQTNGLAIFQNSQGSTDRNGMNVTSGSLRFGYYDGAWHSVSGAYSQNEWIHAVGVNDGGVLSLYLNGVKQTGTLIPYAHFDATNFNLGRTTEPDPPNNNNYFNGKIDHVMVWSRALSAAEIAQLYREPFCMFAAAVERGLLYPAGQIVLLDGTSMAAASASGTLTKEAKLAGTIDTATTLSGMLTLTRREEIERQWLTEALFGGMTANAFKLGTVLTGGWFWMWWSGCSVLYRGPSMEQIDFANILAVAEKDAGSMSPPSYVPHHSNSVYFYVIRRFNNCGYQERTLAAAVKMSIDAECNLAEPQPNNIFAWRVEQVDGNKIQLIWFYCPLEQKSEPTCFKVYYDGGTGQIGYENPIATISYEGRKFYSYQSGALAADRYLFAIKAEDISGIQNGSSAQLGIQLDTTSPDAINILSITPQ